MVKQSLIGPLEVFEKFQVGGTGGNMVWHSWKYGSLCDFSVSQSPKSLSPFRSLDLDLDLTLDLDLGLSLDN